MTKLHEVLAAEKTPMAAWHQLLEETKKKFSNTESFFSGHSKSLKMLEDTPQNATVEAAAREEKAVVTTVFETLEYALEIYGRAEDLQYQKNATNIKALGKILWKGEVLIDNVPVDELMGLEKRLQEIRSLILSVPTLDASRQWRKGQLGAHVWELHNPIETTKTEKHLEGVTLKESTKEHPAQVQAVTRDTVVGKFTTVLRSGAATAAQKAEAIKTIDQLLVEVKQARVRTNDTVVENRHIADKIVGLILAPFAP